MLAYKGEVKGMEIIADRSQLEMRGTLDKHRSEGAACSAGGSALQLL